MKKDVITLIDKAIAHLESMEEASHKIRFATLQTFVTLQTDTKKGLKDPFLLTAIAYIAWNSTSKGKLEI